jgi:hypothetical protein
MNIEKEHLGTANSIPECTNYLFRIRHILPHSITCPSKTMDKYILYVMIAVVSLGSRLSSLTDLP